MRKVKFTQSNWHEKLSKILDDFPKVDDMHPFFGDLLNVLYDRDHYKLALGQLHTARSLIDKVSQDYVRMMKYGDSLYRCKELKRAALGRMCTIMKKQGPSLAYLEQVRQHMSRLPAIEPNTRTLLVCGYPNVGKSSFMNKVTRADVDVQPYAFTTKSLFVGHMDYRYLRWQVIDTPGILDRPLEERNTIEMQSITALAHLRAAVLYIMDISEQCGHTLAEQAALFHSIKPLFANKPLLIVANKTDVTSVDSLSPEDKALLDEMVSEAAKMSGVAPADAKLLTMSTLTEEGVMAVKHVACDRLLASRVEAKLQGRRIQDVAYRMHVATPAPRDRQARPPVIPASVAAAQGRAAAAVEHKKKTEKDLQEENGGAGVYSADLRKNYSLHDPSWKHDIMPEIIEGHNVLDFIDPDIEARLEALEREEDALAAAAELEGDDMDEDDLSPEQRGLLKQIRARKAVVVAAHRRKKSAANNAPVKPRRADADRTSTTQQMKASLARVGVDASAAVERARARSVSRVGRKRLRSASAAATADMEVDGSQAPPKKRIHSSKSRSMSRGRALSTAKPIEGTGLKNEEQHNKAIKIHDKMQRRMGKAARRGEADRHIPDLKPKHLFSGKRGIGKTDRR
ncbi:Nucleolar GTP-binding protein 1 [Coccomyxa sp. Obi]|nr:Nucleolar GTP-binding protein 1 [Coccomyxa sp. Obi]